MKKDKEYLNYFNLLLLSASAGIILFLFVLFLLSFTGFIFHISIQKVYIFISLITVEIFLYFFNKNHFLSHKFFLLQNFSLFLIFCISFLLAYFFYDFSYDGRQYHQETIILLSNNWNPIFEKPFFDYLTPSIWVEHYQKCTEILSANFVLLFNNIEVGKIINYLFANSIFCLSFFTFNKFKSSSTLFNFILSVLILLNPVSLVQIRTYYSDIIVYYLFIGILFTMILKEKKFINEKLFLFLYISQITMLCNIKLGGLFYSIILVLFYFIYSLIIKKYTNFKPILRIITISGVLILLSGINPYFTNIKQGYHPFYPLVGSNKIDIITENSPKNFKHKNPFYKLFISTFSNTEDILLYNTDDNPKLKIPFSITNQGNFYTNDMRIGGFGYYWSGILLLLIPFVRTYKNSTNEENKIYYFVITTLWLSVLLNPVSWWARYVPQFWLIPIFIIFWKSLNKDKTFQLKRFSFILILFLFINS